MRALVTLIMLATSAGVAWAHGYEDLGTLEKQAVDEALALRGLTLEPQPDGKTIAAVHVVNLDVFSPRDLFFQFFNRFHWTTRDEMIRREALFRPGQIYQQALVDETTRNLESPVYTSALGIVAVRSATPGQVEVLIVTRDLWSLRFNTNFELQQGRLTMLSASLAENNLFGWRKSLALVADLDQGRLSTGPTYVDSNIAGTRLTATASARAIFGRESHAAEGSSASLALGYPLYALDRKWGGGISYAYSDGIVRSFLGNKLRPVTLPCPDTAPPNCTPVQRDWIYHQGSFGGTTLATRRFHKGGVIHEVSAGHRLSLNRPSLLADFPADSPEHPTARQEFIKRVLPPHPGYDSRLYLQYELFTPRYRIYRDFNTFDLRESARLGPNFSVNIGQAARVLGSDREYVALSVSGGWTFDLFDGWQAFSLGWSTRHQDGTWTDQLFSAVGAVATPVIARALRVVASAGTAILLDDTRNAYVALGGDSGLRGYTIGDLLGKSSFIAHLEVRSMALSVLSLRAGGLLFYDVGDAIAPDVAGSTLSRAFATLRAFTPHHDLGFGLRILIPQFNTYVLRVDWAFATQTTPNTRAGWPGRFSAGFSQVF